MANDLNVNEFKLKDPVRNIPDGLKEPVTDATPGFFRSLRNPYHLMLEESLPASLYQWITGNTKKKQAQEALDWIRNNPDQQGSKIYQEAERKLKRFGYLLEEGPMSIDFKEIGNMIKANPKMFGAELINMLMADPWIVFMPLGWHRLGRGVVNAIKLKLGKNLKYTRLAAKTASDLKVGATATLALPFVFSTTWQLAEDRTLDPKRTAIETTIGATAGALFSVAFAGAGEIARRTTHIPRMRVNQAVDKVLKKHGINPEKLMEIEKDGHYRSTNAIVKEISKQSEFLQDPTQFKLLKAEITAALREINENARDMSFSSALKTGGSLAAIGATAQFLTAEDEKLLATAKGAGAGAAIYLAGRFLGKGLRKASDDYQSAALAGEAAMDTARMITVRLNSAATELSNKVKFWLPDAIDSRPKVFYFLQGARVDPKTLKPPVDQFGKMYYNPKLPKIRKDQLTLREQRVAGILQKIFNDYDAIFGAQGARLYLNKRANYLPLMYEDYNPRLEAFKFVKDLDNIKIAGQSPRFIFSRRRVIGKDGDINEGLKKGLTIRKGMDDPAELIRLYGFAAGKALSTRALITDLQKTQINKLPLLSRDGKADKQHYSEFKHPYFADDHKPVWVHKGMINSLNMIFDATNENALMGALFTTNLMMKRLAVGFSFFHAGALVESMWFAGAKWNFIKKVLNPRSTKELNEFISNPQTYIKDFPHAIEQLNNMGYRDVIQFARGVGVSISTPEDTGRNIFQYNLRQLDVVMKRHFGISTGGRASAVFGWFDRVTWDRVFTQAKLHAFLTALNKETILGAPNKMRIVSGDTMSKIYYKGTQAAQFVNDAFGGQNWAMLANRTQNPLLKSMLQTSFAPGSRGYMQLLLFAPDWTISNIRIIAKSLPAFESDPGLRRLYQYYFARAALTYAAAGSVLNYIFSGHSILENTDPTRIDLGNGEVLTFSKQLMEPFHWITAPQATGLKKIGSLPRTTIEVLTNKKYLTTKWSPNITKKDDEAIEKGLKIGGHVGRRFLPIWLQTATQNVSEGLKRDGLSADLAADTAVDFVLGQLGHPRYQGPRYTQYKTKGLVRSPYETLF